MEYEKQQNRALIITIIVFAIALFIAVGLITLRNYFFTKLTTEENTTEIEIVGDEEDLTKVIFTEELDTFSDLDSDRNWIKVRIWRKIGNNEPEVILDQIGQKDEYPLNYQISPDNSRLFINLESKVVSLDLETLELEDVFVAEDKVQNTLFNESGDKFIIWEQDFPESPDYKVHEYDLADKSLNELASGTNQENNYLFPAYLRNDDILLLWEGYESVRPFYMDLNESEVKSPNITPGLSNKYSSTGKYLATSTEAIDDICNEVYGVSPSTYEVYDAISGEKRSDFGQSEKVNQLLAFSKDDSEVLYQTYTIPQSYDECGSLEKEYYLENIESDSEPQSIENHEEVLAEWNENYTDYFYDYENQPPMLMIDGKPFLSLEKFQIAAIYE